ncbi:uncharacterized protein LOC134267754 [Saccostrea cucullata]|uniref:uncharacterized protein LOC134267754 n=1 Tax=Saccostrea cuccullata TaxID=36930 RepID=UPI002ED65D8F
MAMEDMHVEVYMNNSPCRDCAERLLEFLTSHRRANITIHFSNLYKIWRKSCIMERCKHWLAVKRIDSNDNADGLRMLMDHRRCNIQPFDCKAWLDLMGILHIQSPEFEQIYMYQNDGNDRSREKEDTLLQKDLNLITDQEMCMEEEVFYQLFSLQGTMIIVYIVNNENRARFSTRAFHGETKDEEEFRRDI